MMHLVLGGARSGKSRYAESLFSRHENSANRADIKNKADVKNRTDEKIEAAAVYVATATAGDEEMAARITRHRADRAAPTSDGSAIDWTVIEEPRALAATLAALPDGQAVLVDCLTLYLTNWLCADDADGWAREKAALLEEVSKARLSLVMVSNEVGSGIVPLGELSRRFVDEAGWLNQALAQLASQVTLVVAGYPLVVKAHDDSHGSGASHSTENGSRETDMSEEMS